MDIPISTSTSLATRDQLFSTAEQLALAGFLAGYSGLTRDASTLDLRQYVAWCTEHHLAVFGARRAGSDHNPSRGRGGSNTPPISSACQPRTRSRRRAPAPFGVTTNRSTKATTRAPPVFRGLHGSGDSSTAVFGPALTGLLSSHE